MRPIYCRPIWLVCGFRPQPPPGKGNIAEQFVFNKERALDVRAKRSFRRLDKHSALHWLCWVWTSGRSRRAFASSTDLG